MIFLNKRVLIPLIIYILVLAGITVTIVRPLMTKIYATTSSLQERHATLTQNQQKLNQLKELDKSRNDVEEARTLIAAALPDTLDQDRLLLQVEKIALDNHVAVSNLTVQSSQDSAAKTPAPKKGAAKAQGTASATLPLGLDITGTYEDVRNVLQQLENNQRVLTIGNVMLTMSNATGQSNQLQAAIKFSAYAKGNTL